jgi:carboxypeptidase C (cathepsin A)
MRLSRRIVTLAWLELFAVLPTAFAQTAAPVAPVQAQALPADAISRHSIEIGGKRVSYTATAGMLPNYGAKAEVTANIFYVAYTGEGSARPITFVFNGGPGAASAFLQLGAMGPRVVEFAANGAAAVQPVQLVDNPDTWLNFTDLVFVDPVGTGFSRTTAGTEEADHAFFGVEKDADALSAFVRLYLTRAGRELSRVFLTGESYGGLRCVLLANRLLSAGVAIQGLVLISPALEFSVMRGDRFSILPLALALPSMTAAHFEMRDGVAASLDGLREVEQFARTRYLIHLAAGLKSDAEIDNLLVGYTGLPLHLVQRQRSRITINQFMRGYQKRNDRVLSSYDATVSTPVPRGGHIHFDPILDGAVSVLTPAFGQYVRSDLGYRTDAPYRLLNRDVSGHWDFGTTPTRQGYAGSLDELQAARTQKPALGVLIVHGYTDLVIPYSVSRYLIDQLAPIDTARPIQFRVYRGGHMMYLRPSSRGALREDAFAFYRGVLGANE